MRVSATSAVNITVQKHHAKLRPHRLELERKRQLFFAAPRVANPLPPSIILKQESLAEFRPRLQAVQRLGQPHARAAADAGDIAVTSEHTKAAVEFGVLRLMFDSREPLKPFQNRRQREEVLLS